MDGRPKRCNICAFSKKNIVFWTGLQTAAFLHRLYLKTDFICLHPLKTFQMFTFYKACWCQTGWSLLVRTTFTASVCVCVCVWCVCVCVCVCGVFSGVPLEVILRRSSGLLRPTAACRLTVGRRLKFSAASTLPPAPDTTLTDHFNNIQQSSGSGL